MRVALVLDQFDPRRGGAEIATSQFAAELLRRGHEVHVVAKRFAEPPAGVPIVAHPVGRVRSSIDFARAAEAKLRSLSLDLIHDMGGGWYCDVFQPHAGSPIAVSRQKLLLLPRWTWPWKRGFDRLTPRHRRFRKLLARQCVDDGRLLIAGSKLTAEHFQRFHAVRPERIRVIYNGVDTRRFTPENRTAHRETVRRNLGIDDDTVLLLIVAKNCRLKGVPTLLRAMGRLVARRMPVHLLVVGSSRIRRYVRAAERLGAAAKVTFAGSVEEVVPFYAAADVYVHPAIYDTCSLVVLEALASGLPVITSRFNGAGELLTEGVQGYVLSDPTDADELLGRIESLLEGGTRDGMGEAARRLALQHTFTRHVDEMLAVYQEVRGLRRAA